ncbi:alpha-glucuronidase family glycosyl hydrolase [Flindersiella endophytica]
MGIEFSRRRLLAGGGAIAAGGLLLPSPIAWAEAFETQAQALAAADEDGHELWLRYRLVDNSVRLSAYRRALTHVVAPGDDDVLRSAAGELQRGLAALTGRTIPAEPTPSRDGAVIVGTPETSPIIAKTIDQAELERLGPEGYRIKRQRVQGFDAILVAAKTVRGALYGTFDLLRRLQTHQDIERLDVRERPANPLRLANHWDNLDGSVERGYAGTSIFDWHDLPEIKPHYADYARALASIGMNGAVVNNVNANAKFLDSDWLERLAPLADVFRKWGLTFYLSANFAGPIQLGGLPTADPLDEAVIAWWRAKAAEIYDRIPGFGGFLVKANSEGQPGPVDYGRTHADGANLLANALQPYGGIVVWRAFVWHGPSTWAQESYETFQPLDGQFADNVILQIKNGPIDFQVREPVHPLFGALPNTNSMMELQVTQEYTGQSTHVCYLVPLWKEVYDFDTHAAGAGTTVADIVSGSAYGYSRSGVAGVMNFGDSTCWTGHHLAAANTHGYGRLAWNPALKAADLAGEWARMTFGPDPRQVQLLSQMLLRSRAIYESYNSPLAAGFVQGGGDHFDPCLACNEPWHQSDAEGLGFDRTIATGPGVTGLYHPPVRDRLESLETCPDELLLFFHHVPYTHRLHSGKTVIQHIYDSHFDGLQGAAWLRASWQAQRAYVDARRYREILDRLDRQVAHARQWRDTLLSYWYAHSRILDERRSWVQAQYVQPPRAMHEGTSYEVRLTVGNASRAAVNAVASLEVPDGWNASRTPVSLPAGELTEVTVTVQPGPQPAEWRIRARVEAGDLEQLVETAEILTAPDGQGCVLALDAGPATSPLQPGYTRLTPDNAWDPAAGFGWVAGAPQSRDRGADGSDPLLRDFVNDSATRTLRVAVPPGVHDTYLLVGDEDVRSFATYVHVDGELVGESRFLFGNEFTWLTFALDGGTAGRDVDIVLSAPEGEHWHLVALTVF